MIGPTMRRPSFAGLLDSGLGGLIAEIVSRPYRAWRAPAADVIAVIDELPSRALQTEIDALPPDQRLWTTEWPPGWTPWW